MLLEVLASKTRDWLSRHCSAPPASSSAAGSRLQATVEPVEEKLEGPGLYVFKHRERQCFQIVGRAADGGGVFARCAERLKAAFDGTPSSGSDPLAALLVISLASDWDFYFVPVAATGQWFKTMCGLCVCVKLLMAQWGVVLPNDFAHTIMLMTAGAR